MAFSGTLPDMERLNWRQRINRWLLELTKRRIPELGRLLRLSNSTVDRLTTEIIRYREREAMERDESMDYIRELREAIAIASDSWAGPLRESAGVRRADTPAVAGLREAVNKAVQLRETVYGMQELELAIEDRGWKRMIAQSQYEFSRFGLQSIILICRLYYLKNPLIRRGVQVSSFYVFGRGMEVSSEDETANARIQEFFQDPRNASQLSHSAFTQHEQTLHTDGNLFWALFTDPKDGGTVIREFDCLEIQDIVTDPNDASVPWFYLRQWTESTFDPIKGEVSYNPKKGAYVAIDWEHLPNFPTQTETIQDYPLQRDDNRQPVPVLHIKDGALPKWRFGCPRVYPAIDWARAYREGLENLCTLWKALSRYAWRVETEGGAPAIAAFKQALSTTLANNLTQIDTNPPPITGSAFIADPSTKIEPIKTSGMTMSPEDLRRVMLMVCASFGLAESYFGDITSGSFATAASQERPAELMFLERQEMWRSVLQRLTHYILSRDLRATKGKLRAAMAKRQNKSTANFDPASVLIEMAPLKSDHGLLSVKAIEAKKKAAPDAAFSIMVNVTFPDILAHDIKQRVEAIVQAMTLSGFTVTGIDEKVGVGLLLAELGVEDVQAVLDAMYPEKEYSDNMQDRTAMPEKPGKITGRADATADIEQSPDEVGGNPKPPTTKESQRFRDAKALVEIKKLLERAKERYELIER